MISAKNIAFPRHLNYDFIFGHMDKECNSITLLWFIIADYRMLICHSFFGYIFLLLFLRLIFSFRNTLNILLYMPKKIYADTRQTSKWMIWKTRNMFCWILNHWKNRCIDFQKKMIHDYDSILAEYQNDNIFSYFSDRLNCYKWLLILRIFRQIFISLMDHVRHYNIWHIKNVKQKTRKRKQ